jgi:6-phosphogluconate dehydrogenase
MADTQPQQRYEIGMVGLGVMGRNLLLNMADNGFSVAGYDKDPIKVEALRKESADRDICGAENINDFIGLLRPPCAVMMLVPAGAPVDSVINDLLAHVQPGDLIIDAGNSHFKDTNLHARNLTEKGIQFMGVGVSGGEEGARHGPSIMPGGPKEAYERVRPVFEAAAAKVSGDPCVSRLGPGSAGHFVKMVHNGIEYGVMQLIAETYDLMKRSLGLNNDELQNLPLDPEIRRKVLDNEEKLRHIVCTAAELGVPVPGFMTALGYLDRCRSAWLPMNLIQAQRDYFGAHTYERIDAKGTFHTKWEKS